MDESLNIEELNCASRKRRRHHHQNQNVAVFTPPVHQTTAKRRQRQFPSIDYESLSSPFLPDDLIFEILLRLPVKSLLRFKCTCKSLKTLISDPKFAKQHLSHSNLQRVVPSIITKPCTTVKQNPSIIPSTAAKVDSFRKLHQYRVLGSCNGLLCVYNISKGYFRLFNPSTRLRSKKSPKVVLGIMTINGFGYDHVNDKYKVLITVHCVLKIVTQIYTFGEKSWTTIQNLPYTPFRWSLSATFVSGTLNWVAQGGVSSNQYMILSFDLEKETYGQVLLPQHDGDKNCVPVLDVDVLSKCLCVCLKYDKTHWAMWRLKEYGDVESWTKLMMIPDEKFWHRNWRPFMDQFCISNKGVVDVLVENLDSEFVLYDSNDSGFNYPKIWRDLRYYLHICHESLVSPRW